MNPYTSMISVYIHDLCVGCLMVLRSRACHLHSCHRLRTSRTVVCCWLLLLLVPWLLLFFLFFLLLGCRCLRLCHGSCCCCCFCGVRRPSATFCGARSHNRSSPGHGRLSLKYRPPHLAARNETTTKNFPQTPVPRHLHQLSNTAEKTSFQRISASHLTRRSSPPRAERTKPSGVPEIASASDDPVPPRRLCRGVRGRRGGRAPQGVRLYPLRPDLYRRQLLPVRNWARGRPEAGHPQSRAALR